MRNNKRTQSESCKLTRLYLDLCEDGIDPSEIVSRDGTLEERISSFYGKVYLVRKQNSPEQTEKTIFISIRRVYFR